MYLKLCTEDHEERVTQITPQEDRLIVRGETLSATVPFTPLRPAGDCSTGHPWSRWETFISEKTSYERGLWTTVRTPTQRRLCTSCGLEEHKAIKTS